MNTRRTEGTWYLESLRRTEDGPWQIPITGPRFQIGRQPGFDLTLRSDGVSKAHAEIEVTASGLRLRDLDSRNGTYLNLDRISEAELAPGDIVSFAGLDFRVERGHVEPPMDGKTRPLTELAEATRRARHLPDLIAGNLVDVEFQPLVALEGGQWLGLEALGRGRHPELPADPGPLFRTAASLGRDGDLSGAFRRRAGALLADRQPAWPVFVNTIPAELEPAAFAAAIGELCALAPGVSWVVEVHETAIVQPQAVRRLREVLQDYGAGLAFDDFGAGQARLIELGDSPPDFLKFDAAFIRGLEGASASRRRLLGSLVRVAQDLGSKCVAECVETAEQADICRELGFDAAQGYHFVRPGPLDPLLE